MNSAEKCDTIENENPNNRRNPLVANNVNVKKLEADLWESADLLRAGSKLTSNQYCMPVLGLIFLRYAYSRFKLVEQEILKDRPMRGGRVLPVEQSDFAEKSALFLPKEAQYNYLVNLPANIPEQGLTGIEDNPLNSLGEVVNNAMELVEQQSEQLQGVLPKDYTIFSDELLGELLRIFNNDALDDVGGDVIGRIYEYFLNKFAKNVAQDDGVFFTPKSLVKMIVNVLEPSHGVLLDPACGSGGMFVQTGDFVNHAGMIANNTMTFYGQEKVEYNAKLCLMNMAVHGLTGVNKAKEIGNANYLWVSYFYSYLNEHGRAGFVMASSATDSQGKDKDIREKLIQTGHVDVMMSVGNNFFYTKSLPCSLWFLDKGKPEHLLDTVLFIDARNYYTVVDRTQNEWSDWQLKNLNAIVWLYRGEVDKYKVLLAEYHAELADDRPFAEIQAALEQNVQAKREEAKAAVEAAPRKERKATQEKFDKELEALSEKLTVAKEAVWLTEKFGEGVYQDIPGLCKVASRDTILNEKGASLTPGAYVGVAPVEDDGVDFAQRMKEIHKELLELQAESNRLMETISKNLEEMGV
jgi:type I restriction enzyme M protein